MKKAESNKNFAKWLIPVIAVVLLAAVGAFFLFGGEEAPAVTQPTQAQTESVPGETTAPVLPAAESALYWNVDRLDYVAAGYQGTSGRNPREDGYYYIRFAVNGEQVDLPVADRGLVDRIDMMDIMSLVLDDEGVVVDVRTLDQCTGGLLAPALYVGSVEGNTVVANTQGSQKGFDMTFELTEDTLVYDVGGVGLMIGLPGQIKTDDEVLVVLDTDGNVSHVYVKGYNAPKDIYWNLERKYNSTTKQTTRESSVTGVYEFRMALDGQVVTVRTRDQKIANKIDSFAAKYQGLEFDENGYVTDTTQSNARLNTTDTFASWARVDRVEGNTFHAYNSKGTEFNGEITERTKIMDVSAQYGYCGELTDLREGDQIHCMLDMRGRISHIFVLSRLLDEGLYWNVERKYDSTNKVTTRVPAADGYYYFTLARDGQQVTVRTKDKAMATRIDGYATRCFALTLDGMDIVKFHYAEYVHGNNSPFGSWYFVEKIEGDKISAVKISSSSSEIVRVEGVMSPDVQIINGSGNYRRFCGEYSELHVGDKIHGLRDYKGQIRVIFIVDKTVDCPIYWNISRKYDSANKVTTRTPDADGYYHFRMAANGQVVNLKTKDKDIATKIDSNSAKCWGLTVADGIIYKVHGISSVRDYGGSTRGLSWVDVTSVSKYGFTTVKPSDGKTGKATFAWDCKVVNVSNGFVSNFGEYTDLRVGDRVHVLHDNDLCAKLIFVVGNRNAELTTQKLDCPCGLNPNWEPWDGTTPLESGKYYYLTRDVQAPDAGFYLDNMDVSLRLDGHTISSNGRCFYTNVGAQLNICNHTGTGKLIGGGVEGQSGGVIRVYDYAGGSAVRLWNVDISATGSNTPSQGGLISVSGPVDLYNCTLHGGKATSGGNVLVNPTGVFRMFGGSLIGGKATTGGNLHINNGILYLEDVTVSGGQADGKTDNLNLSSTKEMAINGLTVTNSGGAGVNFDKGTVALSGNIQIHGNTRQDLLMGPGAVFTDAGLDAASKIVVEAAEQDLLTGAKADLSGCFVSFDSKDYTSIYDAENQKVRFKCLIVPQTHETDHCACAGLGAIGDHTCETLTGWTEITDSVFETAIGTNGKSQGLKFKQDGNYYLSVDYTPSGRINIMPGQNITICLNGCELSRTNMLLMVAGNVNITDCKGGGTMIGSDPSNGGTVKLVSGGNAKLFAGSILGGGQTASSGGGVLVVSCDQGDIVNTGISSPSDRPASSFTMYGGTVSGGKSTRGGNVCVWHAANFTMYGGTLENGTATTGNGGNLAMESTGQLKLLGGSLTGGTAKGLGGGVYVLRGTVTLGGNMQLTGNQGADIALAEGRTLTLEGLTGSAVTSVYLASPGAFAQGASPLTGRFTSANTDLEVTWKDGWLRMTLSASAQGHVHCVCGGSAKGLNGHECENVLFEEWTKTDSLPTSGYYCLTDDVELSTNHKLGANNDLVLCLHGHTVSCKTSRLFWLDKNSGSLTVTDCTGKGTLAAAGVAGETGGVIRSGNEIPVLSLYNLKLTRIDDSANRVAVKEGGLIICSGFLNMYNVTGTNGYASYGGGLHLSYTCKAVIVNSTVTGCTAVNGGGNLRMGGSVAKDPVQVTLIGSTFTDGHAPTGADAYLAASNTQLILSGKTTIGELYMVGSGNVTLQDLDTKSTIGLAMAENGQICKASSDLSACFIPSDSDKKVVYDGTALNLTDVGGPVGHTHCICGGLGEVGDHTCDENITWIPVTDDVFNTVGSLYGFKEDGHYYLTGDYVASSRITIRPGQNISLCLNGYTLSRGSGSTLYYVGGHSDICDCRGGGKMTGNYAGDGGNMKLVSAGSVNLFGGTITRGTNKGAPLVVSTDKESIATTTETDSNKRPASTFKMYGGTITGGTTAGNVKVYGNANFIMYGGSIENGTSTGNAGNMTLAGVGTVKLLGGSVTGGTAADRGNDVYATRAIEVGGTFRGDITLGSGGRLTFSTEKPLTAGAAIGIAMVTPGLFAENVTTDVTGYLQPGMGYTVAYDPDAKTLTLQAK